MGRVAIRDRVVDLDIITRMRALFGDIKNVQRNLGLEREITYAVFYRAMNFGTIRAEEKVLIEARWARWQELYLRPGIPVSQPLKLTPELIDDNPAWLEGTEAQPA